MRTLVIICLIALSINVGTVQASSTSITVTCCQLMKSFTKHINSKTDKVKTECDDEKSKADACETERFKLIERELKEFGVSVTRHSTTSYTISLSEEDTTEMMVLSVLGRLIGRRHGDKKPTLSYVFNDDNHTLVPEFDSCKFEKILYVTLLCTTIVILIVLLTLQMEKPVEISKQTEDNSKPQNPKQKYILTPTDNLMAFGNQMRYRV